MTEGTTDRLQFRRVLSAPRERVFKLWTQPEHIERWFGGLETEVSSVEIDLRPGGAYAITVQAEEGPSVIRGEFVTVKAPERLVYTWRLEGGPADPPETTVEVTFNELTGGTEVLLVHAAFAEPKIREMHAVGWEACFVGLEQLIAP